MDTVASLIADMVEQGVPADIIGRTAALLAQREPTPAAAPAPVSAHERRKAWDRDRKRKQVEIRISGGNQVEIPPEKIPPTPALKDVEPNLVTVQANQNPPHPPIVPPAPRKAGIVELFEQFWDVMRPSRGKAPNPRKPAFEKFERLIRQGVPVEDIIGGAKRFEAIERGAGRWGTDKVAQAITWLNQHRWEGYGVEEAKPTPRATNGRHFVRRDSAQWWAWRDWMIAQGKRPISMTTNVDGYDGWYFETEWPPGALDAKKAPAEEPTPSESLF